MTGDGWLRRGWRSRGWAVQTVRALDPALRGFGGSGELVDGGITHATGALRTILIVVHGIKDVPEENFLDALPGDSFVLPGNGAHPVDSAVLEDGLVEVLSGLGGELRIGLRRVGSRVVAGNLIRLLGQLGGGLFRVGHGVRAELCTPGKL